MKSNRTRNLVIGGAAVLAVLAGGGAYAIADSDKEKEKTLTAAETQKAEAAAGREVDGQVLYVEYEEDYGGGYEVEMVKKDGSEVEVYLDRSFEVAGVETEHGDEGKEMGDHGGYGSADAGTSSMQGGGGKGTP